MHYINKLMETETQSTGGNRRNGKHSALSSTRWTEVLKIGEIITFIPSKGMLAIQSLRLPRSSEAWFGIALPAQRA